MLDVKKYEVIPFVKASSGCDFWRVQLPFAEFGFDFNFPGNSYEEVFSNCKVLTFNRQPILPFASLMEYKKRYGFNIVIDIDDWIYLPPTHVLYPTWQKNKTGEFYQEILKVVDAVTTTTERLAAKLRNLNANTYVIPNAAPVSGYVTDLSYQFQFKGYHPGNDTKFIWAGGVTHLGDVKKTLMGVFRSMPNLHISMGGYDDRNAPSKKHWDNMETMFSSNHTNQNYKRIDTLPIETYATMFDYHDVALASLDINEPWNAYKSSLKAYEAGVKKMACIASACPPYSDDLPDDVVTFCKTSSDWKEAIKKHKDLDYARAQGLKLYEWVMTNRNIEDANEYRLKIFNHVNDGYSASDFMTFEDFLKQKAFFKIPVKQAA